MPTKVAAMTITLAVLLIMFGVFAPGATHAQSTADPFGVEDAAAINVGQERDLKFAIANVVNVALGLLGILAVIIILYAGFKWMTASGNEEQVTDARHMLVQAVIGLAIIMAAWTITNYVVDQGTRAFQVGS